VGGAKDLAEHTSGDDMDSVSRSPTPVAERRNSSPSPDNQTLSSPLKALDISPEVLKLAKGRHSKVIKLALVKSIDKYRQIRDRLEAVER